MIERSMNRLKLVTILLLLGAFSISPCLALPTYTGSLSSPAANGITGSTGGWADSGYPVTLSWTVTNMGTHWKYEYTLDIGDNQGALSSFIIEVSDDIELWEITNLVGADFPELGDKYGTTNPNSPWYGIPGPLYGLKVAGFGENGPWTFSFNSRRNPVWGDFYAKDGDPGGAVWNVGFTNPDPDNPPSNGSIDNHLLVPDTTWIPAPGAILLGSIGVGLVGWLRRRRTL